MTSQIVHWVILNSHRFEWFIYWKAFYEDFSSYNLPGRTGFHTWNFDCIIWRKFGFVLSLCLNFFQTIKGTPPTNYTFDITYINWYDNYLLFLKVIIETSPQLVIHIKRCTQKVDSVMSYVYSSFMPLYAYCMTIKQ